MDSFKATARQGETHRPASVMALTTIDTQPAHDVPLPSMLSQQARLPHRRSPPESERLPSRDLLPGDLPRQQMPPLGGEGDEEPSEWSERLHEKTRASMEERRARIASDVASLGAMTTDKKSGGKEPLIGINTIYGIHITAPHHLPLPPPRRRFYPTPSEAVRPSKIARHEHRSAGLQTAESTTAPPVVAAPPPEMSEINSHITNRLLPPQTLRKPLTTAIPTITLSRPPPQPLNPRQRSSRSQSQLSLTLPTKPQLKNIRPHTIQPLSPEKRTIPENNNKAPPASTKPSPAATPTSPDRSSKVLRHKAGDRRLSSSYRYSSGSGGVSSITSDSVTAANIQVAEPCEVQIFGSSAAKREKEKKLEDEAEAFYRGAGRRGR